MFTQRSFYSVNKTEGNVDIKGNALLQKQAIHNETGKKKNKQQKENCWSIADGN